MEKVKTQLVMAVLGELARARRAAKLAQAERLSTEWSFRLRRLKVWK
jgi:hypothetical protein